MPTYEVTYTISSEAALTIFADNEAEAKVFASEDWLNEIQPYWGGANPELTGMTIVEVPDEV